MSHYLVTGVAGFIGGRVAEQLLAQGHLLTGLDNLNNAYDVRMKQWRLNRLLKNPNFSFYPVDISQWEALQQTASQARAKWKSFDAVINLAARAGVRQSVENPWIYLEANLTGTLNLLELSRQYGIPKFILASTSSVYGSNAPLPTPETATSDLPLQTYAASKKAAEVLCHSYHFLYQTDITIFRYFTVYGPAGRPDMSMFRFTQWIYEGKTVKVNGNGEQSRGFTYIDDIAGGTISGLKPLGYQVINLGGHETITINQLIRKLELATGRQAKVQYLQAHPADMLANWANVDKARQLLGWQPAVSLDEGIRNQLDWYRSEREWASQIATD
jgi:UDP-glucuronate 4-epimerase